MNRILALLMLLLAVPPVAAAVPAPWLQRAPVDLTTLLAQRHVPTTTGALGRNRQGYFHARFQLGVHHLATRAVLEDDPKAAEQALRAIAYALARQRADGRFEVAVPRASSAHKAPSSADLASGSAFFLASAGTAMVLLGQGEASPDPKWLTPALRRQREALRSGLERALDALMRDRALLLRADAHAPNRLLFDALALRSLGLALDVPASLAAADGFTRAALALQHADGYFIEGGGHDSSYNGVACAVGYRVLALDPGNLALSRSLARAISWQASRVASSGQISTEGNTRVRPGGESFLGRAKDVDVPHTVESLMLASAYANDAHLARKARRVVAWYLARAARMKREGT